MVITFYPGRKEHYDREADILMIETVPEGVIDHAEHTGPFIIRRR